jgi:hypothetical protein
VAGLPWNHRPISRGIRSGFNHRRNDIAHGVVGHNSENNNGVHIDRGWHLTPRSNDVRKTATLSDVPPEELSKIGSIADIKKATLKFQWVSKDISYYGNEFSKLTKEGGQILIALNRFRAMAK